MMRLALAMGRTATELEETMPARELAEWELFMRVEAIGMVRQDHHAAQLLAMLANVNRGRGARVVSAEDFLDLFLPEFRAPPPPATGKDVAAMFGKVVA